MCETTDGIDEKYNQVFEEEYTCLQRRKAHDPLFGIPEASGVLHHLYIQDGNNWEGRSEIVQASVSATIAAHERFISELKNELKKESVK